MSSRLIWFGNVAHAQWVPCPKSGMSRAFEGSDSLEFVTDNGGLYIQAGGADHAVYSMEFPMTDHGYKGIEAFTRFKNGGYGKDYLRFIDPMRRKDNLFTQNWAEPGIAEKSDWKALFGTIPTYSDVSTNAYHMPLRKATYNVDTAVNAVPTKQNSVFTLLVPPDSAIWLGAAGSVNGTAAVLRVQPINLDGTLAAVQDITLAADTAQPALSKSFSGATYKAVKVYITRTAATTASITLAALWAQCIKLSDAAPVMDRHIPGLGHSGLRMRGSSRVENYVTANRHLVGASIVLGEVEPWAP